MRSPLRIEGKVASTGYAAGPAYLIGRQGSAYVSSGSAGAEAARLSAALVQSIEEVMQLIATSSDPEAAAILDFQVAMLEDEGLSETAFVAIGEGTDAASAWRAALDEHIAGYEAAEDEYFRARSADVRDIRDRVITALTDGGETIPPRGSILVGDDISPTRFLSADWSAGGGIVLRAGSATSHVAMLARARGIPMLVTTGAFEIADGDPVLLDAAEGRATLLPRADEEAAFERARAAYAGVLAEAQAAAIRPAVTSDGVAIKVMVNIAEPSEVDGIDIATCDGVGLMRTEFLYRDKLPDEDTQYAAYRRVIDWAAGKPVVIRTIDAGGDKPVPGFTMDETNPFLGLRGLRLALARPDVFRVQLRALLRAALSGKVSVMFPMVSVPSEYKAGLSLIWQVSQELAAEGAQHAVPPIGIMVEVPAVAIAPEAFVDAAFFSIGSNDLTQYTMAAGRDNGAVAHLADVTNPAVLRLIATVASFGAEHKIPVSLCGDAGGDPRTIPALLKAGIRSVSVAPAQLPLAKAAIAKASTHG
jgi:phosphotransferase system enzyme I (PtsI)